MCFIFITKPELWKARKLMPTGNSYRSSRSLLVSCPRFVNEIKPIPDHSVTGLGSDCYVHEEVNYLTIQFYIDLLAHSARSSISRPCTTKHLFLSV